MFRDKEHQYLLAFRHCNVPKHQYLRTFRHLDVTKHRYLRMLCLSGRSLGDHRNDPKSGLGAPEAKKRKFRRKFI